eukprot:7540216-Pyramimonas_sp.AAC.1
MVVVMKSAGAVAKPKRGPAGAPRASASPPPRVTPRGPENEDRKGGSPSPSKPHLQWLLAKFKHPEGQRETRDCRPVTGVGQAGRGEAPQGP